VGPGSAPKVRPPRPTSEENRSARTLGFRSPPAQGKRRHRRQAFLFQLGERWAVICPQHSTGAFAAVDRAGEWSLWVDSWEACWPDARRGRRPPSFSLCGEAADSCVLENMNPVCESHNLGGGRYRRAAEGNCVAARRGGEQPEAEDRSQTKVNSIRRGKWASLRVQGEACCESGETVAARVLPMLPIVRLSSDWSGNDRKGAWNKGRDQFGWLTRIGVRGPIVAMKPGNAGGAKGPRKVKAR
jgi:hypothetical protein